MSIAVRSFAKINLGLKIGPVRPDGFHELRTVYQTLALHDVIRVGVQRGTGVELRCKDPRVPLDETNTCYKVAVRALKSLKGSARIVVQIDKQLPVQGGMGAASSNAVATLFGLERALGERLDPEEKLRIAAEVGSDLPLFLVGGTVLGVGHGEEVYPLHDLPALHLTVVTPAVGVSTPKAFQQWDELVLSEAALTGPRSAGTIGTFGASVFSWLSESFHSQAQPESEPASGVPAVSGDRAETPLLDLVRAGIENDFEQVVFPQHPFLSEIKRLLAASDTPEAALHASL
jgi:4-diphosphocytidyl-2-C-methyl-D-erythritol kinase